MTFTKEQLTRIIESADEVITALAGTNDDIHPDNSTKMCAAWDDLNDRNAPPSVVKRLAGMALAGMEAEPVAYIGERMLESLIDGARSCGRVWPAVTDELSGERRIPLYKDTQPLTTSERAELENYRNAQQVVPSDGRDQFEEWFKFHHGDEHSIAMLQRANGGANYIDPYVDLAWISWKDSRAAMLQGGKS